MAVLAVIAMPAPGQDPPPPCAPGTQVTPDRFQFENGDDPNVARKSLTVGHPAYAYFNVSDDGPWIVSASHIAGPPGLQVKTHNGDQNADAEFMPTTPGQLTFIATWTQTHEPDGAGCTGSASASLKVTAPTQVRASRVVYYKVRHRPHKPGQTNEFVLTAYAIADLLHGDRSPIRMTARAVKSERRPPASTRATTVTFDPNGPARGASASTPLLRLHAYVVPNQNDPYEYFFEVGVLAHSHRGQHARRGVEMTVRQGSRTLFTRHFETKCDELRGGLFCYPEPKGSPALR